MQAYVGLAVALLVIALLVWSRRNRLPEVRGERFRILCAFELLKRRRFAFGAFCIFLYVGAEVAIGSVIVNYLERADVLGLDELTAGKHVPYYWGGAMVGRFIGSWFLKHFSPGKVLAFSSAMAIMLTVVSASQGGAIAGWSLLAIGLFNSIMFPTIFSLASEGLGTRAAEGSGIICVMIVGGAIVPLITGQLADMAGLKLALIVPAICYAGILTFGVFARRPYQA